MSQALGLDVILTVPPAEASADVIARIVLQAETLDLFYAGDFLSDPLTQSERRDLKWYLEEYWLWPYEGFAQRGSEVEALLTVVGQRLYQSVFGSPQAQRIMQTWDEAQVDQPRQISIVSDLPAMLSLPWELLHDGHQFLSLRPDQPVSIVRRLPLDEQVHPQTPFAPPLRILLVTAQPEGTGFVDPRSIAHELYNELQAPGETGTIELEFLRPPTLAALQTRLRVHTRPVHVLHFDGHGLFDRDVMKQGMLAFENEEGQLDAVEAERLAHVLERSNVRLVVLTACQSAMSAEEESLGSVATHLIRHGVDAVVAMSADVLVVSAARYAQTLYRAVAVGTPVAVAHEQARLALYKNPYRHLQRRHRDEAGKPIQLLDWWMPHLYLQHAVSLQPNQPTRRRHKRSTPPTASHLNVEMPPEPRYGFTGRARELLKLERGLFQRRLVLISGFGGIGKTALARETADWLTRTRMYDGACFVSFEHGGDSTLLLSMLGHYLGIYDGHYRPNESASALARLKPILNKKRTLLIADNMESILPGGEASLAAEARTQLWNTLVELAQMGAGVILTSRNTAFDEAHHFHFTAHVTHLPLRGLRPLDAYLLATHLLDALGIDPSLVPYTELRDLLAQLDYHPLAIQLVLPVLRDLPLADVRADFEALLPHFADDTETGRNRSLLASLEYSLQRLSVEQRILLHRLVLFQGGASEDNLLAITQIPDDVWVTLRSTMEQAALVRVERVDKDIAAPFLRFHPVLTPFLRQELSLEIEAPLFGRYIQRYYDQARLWYMEDKGNPRPVRALVRRELPNLIQTLHLLQQMDEPEAASNIATSIADFLDRFGLWQQRDELRRSIATASNHEGTLTQEEWLNESGQGDDEYQRSDIVAALKRFSKLLTRVEALPEGNPLGQLSYIHCGLLHRLARCFKMSEQHEVAEEHLHKALTIIDALLKEEPDSRLYMRERSLLLSDRGDIALLQGYYEQAQSAYNEALTLVTLLDDRHAQAVTLGELGVLVQAQKRYAEARSLLSAARDIFHELNEPATEANLWYQLGRLAEEEHRWEEAEHCYRQSLALDEQRADMAAVVKECNQLALVAQYADRPAEAESWYKRALEIEEQIHSSTHQYATLLNNLANLLLDQVWTKQASASRLIEARRYAERALSLDEGVSTSTAIWTTLYILSVIASLEGQTEKAQEYRRRERTAFAAFAGNRYDINRQHSSVIAILAAAVENPELQPAVEEVLPLLEAKGWHVAAAIKHIWSGERNWHLLADHLDRQDALLILRVLETLADSTEEQAGE